LGRLNRGMPRLSSNDLMRWLTAAWVEPRGQATGRGLLINIT